MTSPAGRCPNCGAPIRFKWSSAVQTVCEHCRSVVVRHDVDLEAIGEVSDLPPDSSPIQLGTTGRFDGLPFTVVGRIAYEHDEGSWNEWHLAVDGGPNAWLSDAQAEYAVSRLSSPRTPLPAEADVARGARFAWSGQQFQVTALTRARYRGVDGELPFAYWGKGTVLFVDLRGHGSSFATIDYSEDPPLLFVGRHVEYDDLALAHLRSFEGW